jgi:hypothetical protein
VLSEKFIDWVIALTSYFSPFLVQVQAGSLELSKECASVKCEKIYELLSDIMGVHAFLGVKD